MIVVEFYGSGKKVNFPESLAECNQREYEAMSRFVFLYQSGKITFPQFQRLSVYALLNAVPSKKPLSPETEKAISENVAFLSDFVMNFFDIEETEEGNRISIKKDYIHNHISSFNHQGLTFVGPQDNFQNTTFGQYMDGLGAYLDYEKFGEYQTLIKLLSTFYRPKQKFLGKILKPNLSKLDPGIPFGFYLFFSSFQKWISSGATVVHNGVEIDLSIIFSGEENKNYGSGLPGLGMKSLFHSIAETGIFGAADSLRSTPLWEVLFLLYEMRKKSLDEKAEYDKIKSKEPKK